MTWFAAAGGLSGTHLPGVYNIDLGQVRAVVERLSGFLDGASSAVQADLDAKSEMAHWHGP